MNTIKSIYIKSFKLIKNIEVNDLPESNWIFVTGENGYGKTMFLQALASSLNPYNDIINKVIAVSNEDLETKISINDNLEFGINNINNPPRFIGNSSYKHVVCYGSSRLETLAKISQKEYEISNTGVERLFFERTILRDIEVELISWKLKSELRKINNYERIKLQKRLNWAKNIFNDLLGLSSMTIDELKGEVLYYEKDASGIELQGVSKDKLGSGYKALLGIIGDLIIQLFNTQPEKTEPGELNGIVIIDEIELHLHPKWQKLIPSILTKYFPMVQFVASTHSPIPLLGAPSGSIFFKIERTAKQGVSLKRLTKLERDIRYLLPNSLLTSDIFGLDEIESNYNPRIDAIRTQDNYDEIQELEKAKRKLRKIKESDFPEDLFNT